MAQVVRNASRAVGIVASSVSRVQRKNSFPEAVASCLKDMENCIEEAGVSHAEVDAVIVGNMLAPQLQRQQQFASYLTSRAGLAAASPFTIDAACGSGGAALQLGYNLVQSGGFRNVLVVGFEYMTHDDKDLIKTALAGASNWETEGAQGATFVSLNGQVMTAYTQKYGVDPDELRHISINGHNNANTTDHALFHGKGGLTDDKFRSSMLINPNLVLYAASSICNGSAAVMLSNDNAKTHHPRIIASASAGDNIDLSQREDLTDVLGVATSSAKAFSQARLGCSDIDIVEPHTAYTIMGAVSLEAMGFVPKGQAGNFGAQGYFARDGDLPIDTMGGLLGRGHPVGASGVYQAAEAVMQLGGNAGPNQVRKNGALPKRVLSQSIGGAATSVYTHIFEA